MRRAVFLDRDGTLIEEVHYLTDPSQVRVIPGVPETLARLRDHGFLSIVVTNQSAIARGVLSEQGLDDVHAEMGRQFRERGEGKGKGDDACLPELATWRRQGPRTTDDGSRTTDHTGRGDDEQGRRQRRLGPGPRAGVDAIYYCPHHPDVGNPPYRCICECRKPKPGLLIRAASDLDIDLRRSYIVGDKLSDLEAGWNAGCRSILVLTGYGKETVEELRKGEKARVSCVAEDLGEAARWIMAQE